MYRMRLATMVLACSLVLGSPMLGQFWEAPTGDLAILEEPVFDAEGVSLELTTGTAAGVRVTGDDKTMTWLRWLNRGADAQLQLRPMRKGHMGEMVWLGSIKDGDAHLRFRIPWPSACPCLVEITSKGGVVGRWKDVTP